MDDERSKMLEVAKRYHEKGQKQEEIARQIGLTQPQVSSLLKEAERQGLIRKIIQAPLELDFGEKIRRIYDHIEECLVIGYRGDNRDESNTIVIDELGKMAADHFIRHVRSRSLVGVSCGTTLGAMVNHLKEPNNIRGLEIYSLSIWCRAQIYAISPVAIVSNIIRKCPDSIGYSAQLPGYSQDIDEARREKEVDLKRVSPILEVPGRSEKAKTLYVGLGGIPSKLSDQAASAIGRPTLDFSVLLEELQVPEKLLAKMAGECCFQPYRIDGKILTSKEDDFDGALLRLETNILGFELVKLREMVEQKTAVICAVAGGLPKQRSILGGLRAKIFNHLITDMSCAEYIIDNS